MRDLLRRLENFRFILRRDFSVFRIFNAIYICDGTGIVDIYPYQTPVRVVVQDHAGRRLMRVNTAALGQLDVQRVSLETVAKFRGNQAETPYLEMSCAQFSRPLK